MEGSLNCLALPSSLRRTPQHVESKNHGQDPRQGRRPDVLWRPWLTNPQKATREAKEQECPASREGYKISKEQLTSFRHPVRLFWPKSRSFDYLYAEGEKLLENFPVQATISFYEDSEESGSDQEEEDGDEEEDKEQRSGTAPFLQK
ncbi:protein ripply1 isoform X2 [Paroedura picta]|uniref:protein ripply1 isoform X2 n=1 Tax=Paroedura picta TaxID=143630 RepID=UPI0040566F55